MSARTVLGLAVVLVVIVAASAASRTPERGRMTIIELTSADAECFVKGYRVLEPQVSDKENVTFLLRSPPTPCEVEVAPAGSGKGGGTRVRFFSDGGYDIKGTK